MDNTNNFINSGFYIVPISAEYGKKTYDALMNSGWKQVKGFSLMYLFPYASAIAENNSMSQTFEFSGRLSKPIYMYDKLNLTDAPAVTKIRLTLFATGMAFMYFLVNYCSLSAEEIADFSYHLKRAKRSKNYDSAIENGCSQPLYNAICELLPSDCGMVPFFEAVSDVKTQCIAFHMLYLPNAEEFNSLRNIFLLKRSYRSNFEYNPETEKNGYDMYYSPYSYMDWGGSEEGLVCICKKSKEASYYVEHFHYSQLTNDYLFMYLLLLNQRFSMVKYIMELSNCENDSAELKKIDEKVVMLKSKFSFRIISDDMIYQNIYSKMFGLLQIEALLCDIEECNDRMESVAQKESEIRENRTSRILVVLSFLTLFSALIDASDYFDRWNISGDVSTVISLVIALCAVAFGLFVMFKRD